MKKMLNSIVIIIFCTIPLLASAQNSLPFQTDFSIDELKKRREMVMDKVGKDAVVLLQGAASITGFEIFRQTNTFYYLSGIESGHAYLLLNGASRTTTLYLPHRDVGRERGEGKVLSFEDAAAIKQLTGIDKVQAIENLFKDMIWLGYLRPPAPLLYTQLSPAETGTDSRDELLNGMARRAADPWDGGATRESLFKKKLLSNFPQMQIRDLSPILDGMRLIKSATEIEMIRKATQIAGLAIIEAMRSTKPGIYEYQLDAAARYIFFLQGARGQGYASIIAGGTNAWMGHYFRKTDKLKDGDLVLMDHAPDYRYYTSDVTRMWPVNGTYTAPQKRLTAFILTYRDALFKHIKPGVTSTDVLKLAAAEMKEYLAANKFVKPAYQKAAEKALQFRGHFQHSVGMAVHDVGRVRGVTLQPGMVFTIDPMMWIEDEKLYVRIEDIVVVTESGAENMSAFVPDTIEEIEAEMKKKGVVQFRPPVSLPLEVEKK